MARKTADVEAETGGGSSAGSQFRLPKGSRKFETLAKAVTASRVQGLDKGDRIMYARKNFPLLQRNPVTGGTPITKDQAMELRTVVFGSPLNQPRSEWLRTGMVFRDVDLDHGYGLKAARNGTRGLLSVVQAYVIKHLLFEKKSREQHARPEALLKPNRSRQLEAMWNTISDILWRIGEKTKVVIGLPQETVHVEHGNDFFQDTVTESLNLFEILNLEELQIFIKRYLYLFQEENGCGTLLLLYSAVLTRGPSKIMMDLGNEKSQLVTGAEEGSQNVVMLLLTGRATPYLHNGVVYVGDEDHYALPQFGVLTRSTVGLLTWSENPDIANDESQHPGSRLKTPSLPIWVTSCLEHYGVLFNTNRELLCNYHAERRFDLHYYTCGGTYSFLTVDTRFDEMESEEREPHDELGASPLEKLVHTKWQDAHITWNGPVPTF